MTERLVGEITHYYNRIRVAAVRLVGRLKLGDRIHILGYTTDFEQEVTSMEVEHQSIEEALPKQEIGLRVVDRVRKNDQVYRVEE